MAAFIELLITSFIEFLAIFDWDKKRRRHITGCRACHEFEDTWHFTDDKQLTLAIRKIRKQITLRSFKETIKTTQADTFLQLPTTPPWPRRIAHRFKCLHCSNIYHLLATTNVDQEPQRVEGSLLKLP